MVNWTDSAQREHWYLGVHLGQDDAHDQPLLGDLFDAWSEASNAVGYYDDPHTVVFDDGRGVVMTPEQKRNQLAYWIGYECGISATMEQLHGISGSEMLVLMMKEMD